VVVLAVLLPITAWCIPHLGVSCTDHNSSRIGPIAHSSNRGNSSSIRRNSSSSTVLLLHRHSRLPSGYHSSFPSATFHASPVGRWATLLENAANPSKSNSLQAPTPIVNQQRGHQKGPTPRTGRANYTTIEEIPTREEVLVGTFFLNEHPIIILFDSGASHDFMSSTCAKKAK
jgi:hypothetical protein